MIERFLHEQARYTDTEFVDGVRAGKYKVQQALYEKCRRQFFKGTSNYDISLEDKDDLFQECYIIIWRKIETEDIYTTDGKVYAHRKNGETYEVSELIAYFMKIVKNGYCDLLRRKGRIPVVSEESLRNVQDADGERTNGNGGSTLREQIVYQRVMSLSDSCRDMLTKFYYDGMTLSDILETKEKSKSYDGLKAQKTKCMKKLKEAIIRDMCNAGLKINLKR